MSIDEVEPSVLDLYRHHAEHDVRIIVWIDGIEAEAQVVDLDELRDNNAIVQMLYARIMGEVTRRRAEQQRAQEVIDFARTVAESTSGRHHVLTTLDEVLTPPGDDSTQMLRRIRDKDPVILDGEDYNAWVIRIARWKRWLDAEPYPTYEGYPVEEIQLYERWRGQL